MNSNIDEEFQEVVNDLEDKEIQNKDIQDEEKKEKREKRKKRKERRKRNIREAEAIIELLNRGLNRLNKTEDMYMKRYMLLEKFSTMMDIIRIFYIKNIPDENVQHDLSYYLENVQHEVSDVMDWSVTELKLLSTDTDEKTQVRG